MAKGGFRRTGGPGKQGFLIGVAVAIGAIVFFHISETHERFDLATIDFFLRLKPPVQASDKLVLVEIDDVAVDDFYRERRLYLAKLTRALQRLGARFVGYDITFDLLGHYDWATGIPKYTDGTPALAK